MDNQKRRISPSIPIKDGHYYLFLPIHVLASRFESIFTYFAHIFPLWAYKIILSKEYTHIREATDLWSSTAAPNSNEYQRARMISFHLYKSVCFCLLLILTEFAQSNSVSLKLTYSKLLYSFLFFE